MQKALVIGGSGFIGSHLVTQLVSNGFTVRIIGRRDLPSEQFPGEVKYIKFDISESFDFEQHVKGVDVVFHLASSNSPASAQSDPVLDVKVNLIGTIRLLEAMVAAGVKRLVYISSGGTIYGPSQSLTARETDNANPISSYGIVKVASESYILNYQRVYGLLPSVLRVSNPFGPGQVSKKGQGVVAAFLQCAFEGRPITLLGGYDVERDYIYIDDLTKAIYKATVQNAIGIFNVGAGVGTTLGSVIRAIESATGAELAVEQAPARPFDVKRIVLDSSKFHAETGWRPQFDFFDGVKRQWEWLKDTQGGKI